MIEGQNFFNGDLTTCGLVESGGDSTIGTFTDSMQELIVITSKDIRSIDGDEEIFSNLTNLELWERFWSFAGGHDYLLGKKKQWCLVFYLQYFASNLMMMGGAESQPSRNICDTFLCLRLQTTRRCLAQILVISHPHGSCLNTIPFLSTNKLFQLTQPELYFLFA